MQKRPKEQRSTIAFADIADFLLIAGLLALLPFKLVGLVVEEIRYQIRNKQEIL
jgi:hypothetical protein